MSLSRHRLCRSLFAATLAAGEVLCRTAGAQSLEPYDLAAKPAGTNLAELSFAFDHYDGLKFSDGTKLSDSGYNAFTGTVRYEYSFALAEHPAALQVYQSAAYFNDFHVGGVRYPNASGSNELQAENTILSAESWPYGSPGSPTQISTAVFLIPPDASSIQNKTLSAASSGWSGDARLGIFQKLGANLALEGAFDASIAGSERTQYGSLSREPIYGIQIWADWDWGNGFRTALGYLGNRGGDVKQNGYSDNRGTNIQRIRVQTGYWWTPRLETDVQLARDVYQTGGYSLGFAAIGRIMVLF